MFDGGWGGVRVVWYGKKKFMKKARQKPRKGVELEGTWLHPEEGRRKKFCQKDHFPYVKETGKPPLHEKKKKGTGNSKVKGEERKDGVDKKLYHPEAK